MQSLSEEDSIEFKQEKFNAILRLLKRVCGNPSSTSRVQEPEFISTMDDAVFDSALTEDSHAVLSASIEEKANDPEKHEVDSLTKFRPPRKGVSAIRSFPPGCGRGAPRVRVRDHSKCLQKDGSTIKRKECHGASSKNADKLTATGFTGTDVCKSSLQPPKNESEHLKLLEDKTPKTTGAKESTRVEISGQFDNVKSGRGRLATGPEPMVRRILVQALMAAPNCPWRRVRKMQKPSPRERANQGKGL